MGTARMWRLWTPGLLVGALVVAGLFPLLNTKRISLVRAQMIDPPFQDLTPFLRLTLQGDVIAAGVGLRGTGQGEIVLASVPADARVEWAYLYWATLDTEDAFSSLELEGEPVNGELIGRSYDTCWGVPPAAYNFVYRAEVTGQVTGNGSYMISGLPDDRFAGQDSQGASLVVIYSQPGPYRTVLINDGAVTLDLNTVNTHSTTLGGFSTDQDDPPGKIIYIVGDGQAEFNDGALTLEGNLLDSNVFQGTDGDYWDTLQFDASGLLSAPTAVTTIDNRGVGTSPDCLLWTAAVLSVQAQPQDQRIYLPLGMQP